MVGVVTELLVPLGDNRSADYSSLTTGDTATPYLVIALSSQSASRKRFGYDAERFRLLMSDIPRLSYIRAS